MHSSVPRLRRRRDAWTGAVMAADVTVSRELQSLREELSDAQRAPAAAPGGASGSADSTAEPLKETPDERELRDQRGSLWRRSQVFRRSRKEHLRPSCAERDRRPGRGDSHRPVAREALRSCKMIDNLVRDLQVLRKADFLIGRIWLGVPARRMSLFAFAALIAVFGLGMADVAAFYACRGPSGRSS